MLGLKDLFFQLCCCVSFWFWWEIGFCVTYLCTQRTIQLWSCVSFLVLAGNSFWCYIRTQCTILNSCAVLSVFWLWREIVLKMRTRFYKKNLLRYFIMIRQPMCVFLRPNTLLLCIFLFFIFLLYCTDLHIEVQIRILLHLLHVGWRN